MQEENRKEKVCDERLGQGKFENGNQKVSNWCTESESLKSLNFRK